MISAEDKPQMARLFQFIARGEQIASTCAIQQSKLATPPTMRRFFITQARQERQHAFLFQYGAKWLMPKKSYTAQAIKSFDSFEKKLSTALKKNHLTESIIAQQIILEGLGEITLEKISASMENRGLGLRRIRNMILKQERAHHHFGSKQVQTLLKNPDININILRQHCNEYLQIVQELLYEEQSLFEYFNQNTSLYFEHIIQELPPTLNTKH